MKLLTVEDARARMLAALTPLASESVALGEANGRTLAADIAATRDQPPFAASAMDGWAVRAADTPGRLRIIGESAAGRAFEGDVRAGEATRIFTGAPLPAGADAVVIQEDARRDGDLVEVPAVALGNHVRPAGDDFRSGQALLSKGMRLDPWRLSLAASSGQGRLEVARRPSVVLLSTGEEIVEPGAAAGPFQIYDSGTFALMDLCKAWGGSPRRLRPVGDDVAATVAAVRDEACDLLVTVGGASVGDHDLVKPSLAQLGLEMIVESVAVRPGKPTWFGRLGDGRLVLGLPGNPASSLVCAELFLRSVLLAMQGAEPGLEMIFARAATPFPANGNREHWMRARLSPTADGAIQAQVFPNQDSALVGVFANSDALVRRLVGAPAVAVGEVVEAVALPRE